MAKKEYKKPLAYVQKQGSPNIKKTYHAPRARFFKTRSNYEYQRAWRKTAKTHNPLTGKKNYTAPKAEIYQSADYQKSQTATRKGGRSYRPTPRFGGVVMGAVSLLLVVGLVASLFFVAQNMGRPIGKPFVYFSPSVFLNNISSPEIAVSEGSYEVEIVLQKVFPSWNNRYWGYITVDGKRYKSTTPIYVHDIDKEEYQFYFDLGGDLYGSHFEFPQGPTIDGEPLPPIRVVDLPSMVFRWNNPPDLNEVLTSWENVSEEGTLFDALSATAGFGIDFFRYQLNLLTALLPWNSSVSSDDVPNDGIKIVIPWRSDNMEVVSGAVID